MAALSALAPMPAAAAAGVAQAAPALRLRGICRSFGPVMALRPIDLDILPGEVHAIVGENGAGKSTLIAIAAGVLAPDRGELLVGDAPIRAPTPAAIPAPTPATMRAHGIAVAFQHPALAPDLTVLENMALAAPRLARDPAAAAALIARVALAHLCPPPGRRVAELSIAQRHVVEIAVALATAPRVLFLDEPTEPFQQADVAQLFALVRALRAEGVAIVYVSHRLHEVAQIADRVTVLRDGARVDTRPAGAITQAEIVTLIAGRPMAQMFPPKPAAAATGTAVLTVDGLGGAGFRGVHLAARAGEIVGLAGVEGQGQRAFLRALAGLERCDAGRVAVRGVVPAPGPAGARRAGIAFVTDDRHAEGLFLGLTVRENLGYGVQARAGAFSRIDRRAEAAAARATVAGLAIKTASIETPVASLSGGNQQKVLFGRETLTEPAVLLVDEPTKGVDVGARAEIYRQLRARSDAGTALVVASSDGVELEGLCDRVLVFARGEVVRELAGAEVTDARITEANLTGTALRQAGAAGGAAAAAAGRLRGWLGGEYLPAVVLAALTLGVAAVTEAVNPYFLTAYNIAGMLTLLACLGCLSLAQLCAILVGEIDLSVGPLAGFAVVLASFLLPGDRGGPALLGGSAAVVAAGLAVGLAQGAVIAGLRLPSVVVTLASFIGIQGVSLLLRPRPAGEITDRLSDALGTPLAGVPAAMVAVLVLTLGLDWGLRRSGIGRRLRAVGSDPAAAARRGVRGGRAKLLAFAASGALTGLGGLMLAAQIGIGSATTGVEYTLSSITAVVLGGASVAGGRGSFVCVLAGAALVQVIMSASAFLQASSSWQYLLVGAATLLAAGLFSVLRPRPAMEH